MNVVARTIQSLQPNASCGTVGHMHARWLIGFVVGMVAGFAATVAVIFYVEQELPTPKSSPIVEESQGESCPIQDEYTLYFVDMNHPDYEWNCGSVSPITREIDHAEVIADAVLRQLLQGTTETEVAAGLTDAFGPLERYPEGKTQRLADYYKRLHILDGTVYLEFDESAMTHLNSASCVQSAIKAPIWETMTNLPWVNRVDYVIGDRLVNVWDG